MPDQAQNSIGVALSGSNVRAALVDDAGKIIERREAEISAENLVEQVAGIARDLSSVAAVSSIGIAIPGLVNRQTDSVVTSRFPSTVGGNLHAEFMRA
ncbi:MAG TPA: ROK family protein, partial [Pyrinomonadaceae bacterium]